METEQTTIPSLAKQVLRIDGRLVTVETWKMDIHRRDAVMLRYVKIGLGTLGAILATALGNLATNVISSHLFHH